MLISLVATFVSWLFISQRLKRNPSKSTYQARLLATSFLYSIFYGVFMLTPHLLLSVRPDLFPQAMAIGFVLGHFFLYLSFLQMIRLTISIVPSLSNKEHIGTALGLIVIVLLTVYSASSMIWGTHPQFDQATGITDFNTNPVIDLGNAAFGILGAVPAAILMIVNGAVNPYMRRRSFLIGGGIIILMFAGPLVESAREPMSFAIANSISVLGLLTLTMGVAYRINQNLSLGSVRKR
jgi:hypothetical protein